MSRLLGPGPDRKLTPAEELEQLEQSITLTLQEIDHNFSKAHKIVTTSIIPIVEEYATHSREVWEGARFWKQFFEASANVSLSGYEEQQSQFEQESHLDSTTTPNTTETLESYETPRAQQFSDETIDDLDLSNLSLSPTHSTPRPSKQKTRALQPASRRIGGEDAPRTPEKQTSILDDIAVTPEASPNKQVKPQTRTKAADPLMHTVLDKNYRLQATPLSTTKHGYRATKTPVSTFRARAMQRANLDSSPIAPPPQLTANIYSPIRQPLKTTEVPKLTPGQNRDQGLPPHTPGIWDSDEEEDDDIDEATGAPYGVSPPKTMQFHVPQSRLIRTPAREASKQIVDSILASAGVGRQTQDYSMSEDFEIDLDIDEQYELEDSPSVVKKRTDLDTDIF